MLRPRLLFGIFMAPYHSPRESPTTCYDRDRDLVRRRVEGGIEVAERLLGYEVTRSQPSPASVELR